MESKFKKRELENKGVPINMAMYFYFHLLKLIDKKDQAAIEGNLWGRYEGLRAIWGKLKFRIPKKEEDIENKKLTKRERITKEFEWIREQLMAERPINPKLQIQMNKQINQTCILKMEKIDEELMDIMNENNMIFPNMKTEAGFQNFANRMGVDLNL